jgi:hypothetical protein
VQKYFFNSKLSVDPTIFLNHKFGNFYELVSRTKSLPLKAVLDNARLTLESVAIEVKPMKFEKTLFELPAEAKTMKSPY